MNSAHPFENPTEVTNFFSCVAMMLFPFSLVLMYGRMLRRIKHAIVIFSVMMVLMIGTVVWAIYFDTLKPNPGLTAHAGGQTYELDSASAPGGKRQVTIPAVAGLPVDQHLGNLEGKELRFGTSAGATFSALTVDVTDGAVNCEHDSLNPIAALSPMVGMWLNCIYGGKGVGMINLLLFLVVGVFVAGQMVGRTPEYLGKKIGGREMKLAMIALLVTALVILISRFLPIIAPIAMAASLGAKKSVPFSLGTLRDDTSTFGFLLGGTILIIGALLFLPVAALGPFAEHLGPIPFGG